MTFRDFSPSDGKLLRLLMDSLKTMTFVVPHQITNTFFKKIFCEKKNRSTRHDLNNKEVRV